MARIKAAPKLSKTLDHSSNHRGRIPAALREHFSSGGLYKVVSLDLGTGYTSIHHADMHVKSEKFTNLKGIKPAHFYRYPGNPNHRPETTTEVPSVCAHIPGETDASKALHGYEVDSDGANDDTSAVVVDAMKVALYSGPEAIKQKEILKALALRVPYLVTRYKYTKLADFPETWILADYVLWLVELVTFRINEEGSGKNVFWVCTIPSNWDRTSHRLYADILDSANLAHRYVLQSEVECAVAGLMHQSPKQSRMKDDNIFFVFDAGKGTSDFGVYRQKCSEPRQVEEIMPSKALFAGSRTVLELWVSHIRELCKQAAKEDPGRFESELVAQRTIFTKRMHMYTGLSGETVDKTYYICGMNIRVTRDLMKTWFDEWMDLNKTFLSHQFQCYKTQCKRAPAKLFIMGGSSNSVVFQDCMKGLLKTPFFRKTELVPLGDCNSATIVALGAIPRAVTSFMSTRKSHYWIGLARKDPYEKRKHGNAPKVDILTDNVPCGGDQIRKQKFVRVIHWFAKPGDDCIVDSDMDQIPFIKMAESFNEEGSVVGEPTKWTVPVWAYVCRSLAASSVIGNGSHDATSGWVGKRGWSYQSTRPDKEKIRFELDFNPRNPDPLLVKRNLVPINRFYDISWAIFAETTGIGIDFWCGVYSGAQGSSNTKDSLINMRSVFRVLFMDLVGIIQQSHDVHDTQETKDSNKENEEHEIEREDQEKDDGQESDDEQESVDEQESDDDEDEDEDEGKERGDEGSGCGDGVARHTIPSETFFPGLVGLKKVSKRIDATRGDNQKGPADMQTTTRPRPHGPPLPTALPRTDIEDVPKGKVDEGNQNDAVETQGYEVIVTLPTGKRGPTRLLERFAKKAKADDRQLKN